MSSLQGTLYAMSHKCIDIIMSIVVLLKSALIYVYCDDVSMLAFAETQARYYRDNSDIIIVPLSIPFLWSKRSIWSDERLCFQL